MRITELANPLTEGLDTSTPIEFIRRLAACDTGLFTGYAGYPNVYDESIENDSVKTIQAMVQALIHPEGKIIFGGCGTSGRLAHLLAYELNNYWKDKAVLSKISTSSSAVPLEASSSSSSSSTSSLRSLKFHYLLAGGDKALLVPQEAIEDQHEAGAEDLQCLLQRLGIDPQDTRIPIVLVGISCGLSATYVASLLHSCLIRPNYFAVAMGFNPVEAIQTVQVPGSPYTFYSVLQAMQGKITKNETINQCIQTNPFLSHSAILNPVVGPEAVAGSSRMKGGSITWILCASLCHTAVTCLEKNITDPSTIQVLFRNCIFECEKTVRTTYISMGNSTLPAIINDITESLAVRKSPTVNDTVYMDSLQSEISKAEIAENSKRTLVSPTGSGRILYLGAQTSGLMGLVDASEATDTYGSLFNDVRGFVVNGWSAMGVTMTGTLDPVSQQYIIDHPLVPPELRGYHSKPFIKDNVPYEIADPSLSSFMESFVPTLTTDDCVVYVHLPQYSSIYLYQDSNAQILEALVKSKEKGTKVFSIIIQQSRNGSSRNTEEDRFLNNVKLLCTKSSTLLLPISTFSNSGIDSIVTDAEQEKLMGTMDGLGIVTTASDHRSTVRIPHYLGLLSLKLCLNAITTGAHIGRGVIINNRMVNMMLTNHKLYLRAIGIVRSVCQQYNPQSIVDESFARTCILRSIYGDDYFQSGQKDDDKGIIIETYKDLVMYKEQLRKEINENDSSIMQRTIFTASQTEKVIPVALLLALYEEQEYTVHKDKHTLDHCKILTVDRAREILRKEARVKIALGLVE